MYGGSGTSPISSSTREQRRPGPGRAAAARAPRRAARRPRRSTPPPTSMRRGRRPRRRARASAPPTVSQNRRSVPAVVGRSTRCVSRNSTAPPVGFRPRSRAGKHARVVQHQQRPRGGSSSRISRNRRCLRVHAARSMTSRRASSRASAGAAAMRSGGKTKSKSAVSKPAALCNPLYKTSFLDNTIPFSSPHDHPQGTFFRRDGVPGALPAGPRSRWALLTRRAGRSRSARSSSSPSASAAVAARR